MLIMSRLQRGLWFIYFLINGSQTQPRDLFQHCREGLGEFGKVKNGIFVKSKSGIEVGLENWGGGIGDEKLGVENLG